MPKNLKFWYLLALALFLSLASALTLIFMRQDAWMPAAKEPKRAPRISEGGVLATQSFREWEFSATELENMRTKLEGEKEALHIRETALRQWEEQIRSEVSDLNDLRNDLDALKKSIQQDLITIGDDERQNLRSLSKLYSEMKAPAAVKVLAELDVETVVKILTLMPSDASARILGTFADLPEEKSVQKAAEITEAIRKLKP
jgi:flagellar motility protein MotE (MotC chaperone)